MKRLLLALLLLTTVGCVQHHHHHAQPPALLACEDKPAETRRAWNLAAAVAQMTKNADAINTVNVELAAAGCKDLVLKLPRRRPARTPTPKPTPKPNKKGKKNEK